MKLRNKKTGDTVRAEFLSNWQTDDGVEIGFRECNTNIVYSYNSLAELNEEWEDYKEPKHSYYLTAWGEVKEYSEEGFNINHKLEIGNYFETKEEAEKAVEKLKAWKRLKDAGFWFKSDSIKNGHKYEYILRLQCEEDKRFKTIKECGSLYKDLKFLFGGEE